MKIVHTADWHLGHTLHGVSRMPEHAAFLTRLLDVLEAEGADALIVAGDLFDTANPSAEAQRMLYRFLADARARLPQLDVVLIAGNHDSPGRLEAPSPLLDALGVRTVGTLPRKADGALDADRLIVPLTDAAGRIAARVAAVPFLRPADLPPVMTLGDADGDDGPDPLVEGVRAVYAEAIALARAAAGADEAVLATGHLTLGGATPSESSERRILIGGQHAIPADVFPEGEVAYVALGHLHRAQSVAGRHEVRYAGSPIPLALDEAPYRHQAMVVRFEGAALAELHPVAIPRSVDILRVPERDALDPDALLAALAALPDDPDLPVADRPLVEGVVRPTAPRPSLRREIARAVDGKAVRFVKLTVVAPDGAAAGLEKADAPALDTLTPEDVFDRRWRAVHGGTPPQKWRDAFADLLAEVETAADDTAPSDDAEHAA